MQNEVILTEGELKINMGESNLLRDLQDQVAELKAEVNIIYLIVKIKQMDITCKYFI